MSAEKAWATIEELARYEDEGWNDPILLEEENGVKKTGKIMRYPDTEDLEPVNGHEFSEALTEKGIFPYA
ncbi:hypothetical protein Tco_0963105 [Tanacetum coccineum]